MRLYRVAKVKHAHDLSGSGAALFGGRWNPKGRPVLYASKDARTAIAEAFGGKPPADAGEHGWVLVELELKERRGMRYPKAENLPPNWSEIPFGTASQLFGDRCLDARTLAMRVPSTRVKGGWNYVLNPSHPAYARVRVVAVVPVTP